jgi:DNA-directed RNA polymerase subunit RPC12/RpoP
MSEFKFTCPVCGQHIAADSSASGAQIECPTCFQKIIVPQAPRADSKYILSATQYIKSTPATTTPPAPAGSKIPSRRNFLLAIVVLVALVCVLLAVIYLLRRNPGPVAPRGSSPTSSAADARAGAGKPWTLSLAEAAYPDDIAFGRVHHRDFSCQRAFVQNGSLALRQGLGYQPDLVVNVFLPANEASELSGRSFSVRTNDSGVAPRIVLHWKEADLQVAQTFTNGYAMKLEFGAVTGGRLPGKIYLCLSDASKSFVAGTFEAEIRKPQLPKTR